MNMKGQYTHIVVPFVEIIVCIFCTELSIFDQLSKDDAVCKWSQTSFKTRNLSNICLTSL